MLSDRERRALEQWYSQEEVVAAARHLYEAQNDEELEEYLHRGCLLPLSRHSELPDFMKDEKGETLFPTHLDPTRDVDKWQDAIEVGWEVLERKFGISHDEIHRRTAERQQSDWQAFLDSVERRKKERAAKG
jgi:hypothetical protein